MNKYFYKLQYLIIFVILSINTIFIIGDFKVRLAIMNGDDGPVAYANYYKNPKNYEYDAAMKNTINFALGGMQNWSTAFLYKFLNISPNYISFFFVFLQNILLGFAIFRYTFVITKRIDVAWICLCFTFLARAYTWNIANFGDLMYMPYSAHLALPFIIYAASFTLENKFIKSIVFLTIGGLFHPVFTSYGLVIITIFWIWQYKKDILSKDFLIKLLFLFLVGIISIIPYKISMLNTEQIITKELFLKAILSNWHILPWIYKPYFSNFIENTAILFLFIVLSFISLNNIKFHNKTYNFWASTIISVTVLCLFHLLFLFLKNPLLLRLILIRSTLFAIIFSLPVVITFLIDKLKSTNFGIRMIIMLFLIFPNMFSLFNALLVSITVEDLNIFKYKIKQKYLKFFRVLGYLLFAIPFLLFEFQGLFPFINLKMNLIKFFSNKFSMDILIIFIAASFTSETLNWLFNNVLNIINKLKNIFKKSGFGDFKYINIDKMYYFSIFFIILVMSCFFLKNNYSYGKYHINEEAKAYYDIQLWAKNTTKPNAGFIVNGAHWSVSWSSFADRPKIFPTYGGTRSVYTNTKVMDSHFKKKHDFYLKHCKPDVELNKNQEISVNDQLECFYNLDAQGMKEFCEEFGADYMVKNVKENKKLNFPIVYQNNYFIVYKLVK